MKTVVERVSEAAERKLGLPIGPEEINKFFHLSVQDIIPPKDRVWKVEHWFAYPAFDDRIVQALCEAEACGAGWRYVNIEFDSVQLDFEGGQAMFMVDAQLVFQSPEGQEARVAFRWLSGHSPLLALPIVFSDVPLAQTA